MFPISIENNLAILFPCDRTIIRELVVSVLQFLNIVISLINMSYRVNEMAVGHHNIASTLPRFFAHHFVQIQCSLITLHTIFRESVQNFIFVKIVIQKFDSFWKVPLLVASIQMVNVFDWILVKKHIAQ